MTMKKKAPGTEARRYATRYPMTPNCDRCDTLITGTDSNAIRVELYTSNPPPYAQPVLVRALRRPAHSLILTRSHTGC